MDAGQHRYVAETHSQEIAPVHVMMPNPEAEVLSRRQAAARLGVSHTTLARWAQQGRGPAYSLTGEREGKGRALYSAASIAAWLESRRRTASR